MSCFRLMTRNYLDLDILADTDFSSDQTAFPIENLYNRSRRSKVWRSNGYFEIVSGENTIVFRETSMVDLTATVAASEYTSASALCTAIKNALEAVGASTYTVTYTSALKFQIVSDGAGGGGIFQLIWTDPNSADMASILGFSTSSDDTGFLTYISDIFKINTSEFILWDMGISTNPTSFILAGPRNQPIKLSPSSTITLQGNETNVWTSPSYEKVLSYDDEAICELSSDGLHTAGLRFWRLQFQDQNPLGYLEAGILFLGDHFGGEKGSVQFPLDGQFIDRSVNVFSEGGQTYSDIFEQTAEYSAQWKFLSKEDIEAITDFFEEVGVAVPFFISMDSDSVFSTAKNRRVKYVKFSGPPNYQLERPNSFACTMTFREEL